MEDKCSGGGARREQDRPSRHFGHRDSAADQGGSVGHGKRGDRQGNGQQIVHPVDRLDFELGASGRFQCLRSGQREPRSGGIGGGAQSVEESGKIGVRRRIDLTVDIVDRAIDEVPQRLARHGAVGDRHAIDEADIERIVNGVRAVQGHDRHLGDRGFATGFGGRHGENESGCGFVDRGIERPGRFARYSQLDRAGDGGVYDGVVGFFVDESRHDRREAADIGERGGVGQTGGGIRVGKGDGALVRVDFQNLEPSARGGFEMGGDVEADRRGRVIEQLDAGDGSEILGGSEDFDFVGAVGQGSDQAAIRVVRPDEASGQAREHDALAIHKRRTVRPGGRIEFEHIENFVIRGRDTEHRQSPLGAGGNRRKARAEIDGQVVSGIGGREGELEIPGIVRIDDRVVSGAFIQPRDGHTAAGGINHRLAGSECRGMGEEDRAGREIDGGGGIESDGGRGSNLAGFDRPAGKHLDDGAAHSHGSGEADEAILEGRRLGPREVDIRGGGADFNGLGRFDLRGGGQIDGRGRVLHRDSGGKGDVVRIDRLEAGDVEMDAGFDRGRVIDPRGDAHFAPGRLHGRVAGKTHRRDHIAVGKSSGETERQFVRKGGFLHEHRPHGHPVGASHRVGRKGDIARAPNPGIFGDSQFGLGLFDHDRDRQSDNHIECLLGAFQEILGELVFRRFGPVGRVDIPGRDIKEHGAALDGHIFVNFDGGFLAGEKSRGFPDSLGPVPKHVEQSRRSAGRLVGGFEGNLAVGRTARALRKQLRALPKDDLRSDEGNVPARRVDGHTGIDGDADGGFEFVIRNGLKVREIGVRDDQIAGQRRETGEGIGADETLDRDNRIL